MQITTLKGTQSNREAHEVQEGDFNAESGPGTGVELVSVGPHTLNGGNKRGDWLTQWLMLQKLVALNTMYKKTPEKSHVQDTERCRVTVGLHID